jgi:mono/diheme cytochrome c family protein
MCSHGQAPVPEFRHASWPRGRGALGGALILALASLASAAEPAGTPVKSIQELKAFFAENCVRCHGRDGSARDPSGRKLGGVDFTQAAKVLSARGGPASEREIRTLSRTIRKGVLFGLTMPAWKDQLSEEDATLMVREILLKAEPGRPIAPETGTTASR